VKRTQSIAGVCVCVCVPKSHVYYIQAFASTVGSLLYNKNYEMVPPFNFYRTSQILELGPSKQ